jgi:hypothetical protein
MEVESVIILGKGKSALRCTKEYVLSFDKIAICNFPIIKNYPKNFPYKADWQYRNKSCLDFNKKEFDDLGISKIICTGFDNQKLLGKNNYNTTVEYPKLHTYAMGKYSLDPSSGTQAFIDCVNKGIKKICMVGFDLFETNKEVYFFNKEEAPSNIKYLWGKAYNSENKIITKSEHNTERTFQVMVEIIKENPNISFELYTNHEQFKEIKLKNLTIK